MTKENYLVELMNRYESEENEFMLELEQMSQSIQDGEVRNSGNQAMGIERDDSNSSEVPQDPQPILNVLCSLVDEIGTLRKENRRLKTRLALPPPRMNMMQRMSTLLDSRGITLPKMKRQPEVRVGARERLSTPPRKDQLTASSISTDFSYEISTTGHQNHFRKPPIVQPEMTDSDVEDTAFDEPISSSSSQPRRSIIRRRDLSISECTSPSSASSRDPSENMTSSRSSFFEFFGLKKRKEVINSVSDLLTPSRVVSRRKRKNSRENEEIGRDERTRRIKNRQSARFANEESEEERAMAKNNNRKSASFLTAPYGKEKFENDAMLRVDRETRLRHERDTFGAEVEELKTRNERLVEQLREKSALFSRLQVELSETEREIESYRKKCHFNENLERLSLQERFTHNQSNILSKIEERLRQFETKLQTSRAEITAQQQASHRVQSAEQTSFRSMVEQVERVQRENLRLTQKCLQDCHIEEATLKRKISLLPSYDALYSFSMGMVRKLSELRSSIHAKSCELSRAELDLMAAQSSLLVTHAQIERLRLQLNFYGRKTKRASSFHGEDLLEKTAKEDLHFLLPFKLQASRLDNLRRQNRKQAHGSPTMDSERALEHEFLKLFGYAQSLAQVCDRTKVCDQSGGHFDAIIREIQTPSIRQRQRPHGLGPGRDKDNHRRPISLVELEERRQKIVEEQRRSVLVKAPPDKKPDGGGQSLQDVSSPTRSPLTTPRAIRRKLLTNPSKLFDSPIIGYSGENRKGRLEKQRSIDVEVLRHSELRRQLSAEKPPCEPRQSLDRKYERRVERAPGDRLEAHHRSDLRIESQHKEIDGSEEKRKEEGARICRIQRSAPVSRMRPPHTTFRPKPPEMGNKGGGQGFNEHQHAGYRGVNRTKIRPPETTLHQLSHSGSSRHPSPPLPPFSPTSQILTNPTPSGLPSPSQPMSRLPKPEKRSWIERLKHIKK